MTYAQMADLQSAPYRYKRILAEGRAKEFYEEIVGNRGQNVHVSVGGLDSITLFLFLRSIGLDVPGISVSSLEDKSIQVVHKQLGLTILTPSTTKIDVLNTFGFPVVSKDVARGIAAIQNPTSKNAPLRTSLLTGQKKNGTFNSRRKLPLKWRKLFCGPANAQYGTNYQTAPFNVSNKCCYYMKENPCDDWAKQHRSAAYLGLMASEGGQRKNALTEHGCNYYGKTTVRSCPFATWTRQDLLQLALDLKVPVPEIYGKIEQKSDGTLYTARAQRTGCTMCGFGIHIEKRPHRFDRLREDNPKEWEFWMYRCVTDPVTGEKYGWGRVLDYIGVGWKDDPYGNLEGQTSLFEAPQVLEVAI